MHIIEWILKKTDPTKTSHLKKTGEKGRKAQDPKGDNADLRHKHCLECGRVWETDKKCHNTRNKATGKHYKYKRIYTHYFEDMVTYGKTKEVCPQCKGEKDAKNEKINVSKT